MMDLGKIIMKFGSAIQQNTLLHLATNSIQAYWKENGSGENILSEVKCDLCRQPMTILHLSGCRGAKAMTFHQSLKQRLLNLLRESHCDRNWIRSNHRLDLSSFIRKLFPPPAESDAEAIRLHTARCMMGAFSFTESNAAAKLLQFPISNNHPTPMELFRCCCVDQFSLSYTSWKS
jgi:hypothetical protein